MIATTRRWNLGVLGAAAVAAFALAAGSAHGHAHPGEHDHTHDHGHHEDAKRAAPKLHPRFAAMAPLVGYEWSIETKWSDGTSLRARNEYRIGLNGQFIIADTYAADAGGPEYQRYQTIYTIDPATGVLEAHGFTFDGTTEVVGYELTESEAGNTVISAVTEMPGGKLKQNIELRGDHYIWNVWMQPDGADQWAPMMVDGVWQRGEKLAS